MTIGHDNAALDGWALKTASDGREKLASLLRNAVGTLTASYLPERGAFAEAFGTTRAPATSMVRAGTLRRTSVAVMGLSKLPEAAQREVLDGATATELAADLVTRTVEITNLEDLALVSWAAAETGCGGAEHVLSRLLGTLRRTDVPSTAAIAWALSALSAAWAWPYAPPAARYLRNLLVAAASPRGEFTRTVGGAGRRSLSIVTADQVGGIHALAAYSQRASDNEALDIASACGERFVELQGTDGEWLSHYPAGGKPQLEAATYYSVHHYALAPLALRELGRAGGCDHTLAVQRALRWVMDNPQVGSLLVDSASGVIWRKVEFKSAGRIPHQLVRTVGGKARLGGGFRVEPTARIEDLGWLLYAWLESDRPDPAGS